MNTKQQNKRKNISAKHNGYLRNYLPIKFMDKLKAVISYVYFGKKQQKQKDITSKRPERNIYGILRIGTVVGSRKCGKQSA